MKMVEVSCCVGLYVKSALVGTHRKCLNRRTCSVGAVVRLRSIMVGTNRGLEG